jgi:hypothetical protein
MTRSPLHAVAAVGLLSFLIAAPGDASAATQTKTSTTKTSSTKTTATKTAATKTAATKTATTKTATKKPSAQAPDSTAAKTPATAATAASAATAGTAATKPGDADYTMPGGQEGTVFKSLTVEGEDRVHLEFERPELVPDIDPHTAPGLDPAGASDVLTRSGPDLVRPFAATSALERSSWVARPWLSRFTTGPVARFRPDVTEVSRWRLVVANAKGETVATMEGKGQPPREIPWDGRAKDGSAATPNLTYSYVFEAVDRAGNKRNFVGEGFKVSAYRLEGRDGLVLAFAANELSWPEVDATRPGARQATPPILLEAASWLNQSPKADRPIRVTVTSRSYEQAQATASEIVRLLAPQLAGDPSRVRGEVLVQADSPEGGTVVIAD